MAIIAAFIVNSGLNFALGLLVAHYLGPESYGRYAVAFAGAILVNTVAFEWLRFSTARFYSARTRAAEPAIRRGLDAGYALVAGALMAVSALLWLADRLLGDRPPGSGGVDLGLVAAALVTGVGMGLFDFQGALARARFEGGLYARLVMARNAAVLVLVVGVAAWRPTAGLALMGTGASALFAALALRRRLADPSPGGEAKIRGAELRGVWRTFAAYALPLITATLLYQLLPLASRAVLAARDGFAEAGTFSLAADLGLRLFLTLGTALDLLLFQVAVRTEEAAGRAAGEAQVARNLALVLAILLPFATLLWAATPALEALVVPVAFRGAFARDLELLLPGLLALALVNYGLHPLFQLRRRTAPAIAAALAGVAATGLGLVALPPLLGPDGVAIAQATGPVVACAVLAALALVGRGRLRAPWRDLAACAGATLAAGLAVLPLRGLHPPLALTGIALVGGGVYCGLALWGDVAGLRGLVRRVVPARLPAGARSSRIAVAADPR